MLNYSYKSAGGQSYFMDFVTVPFPLITNGANTITFNNPAKSVYADYISNKYNCVPLQIIVYNTTDIQYTLAQFTNGIDFWCDKINFVINKYTVIYSTDQSKANHTHVNPINNYLTLQFNSTGVPSKGGLNIWIMFSAWPIAQYTTI